MSRRRFEDVLVRRIEAVGAVDLGRRPDRVIVEEPLEIRLDGELVATTMRTPGDDFDLAVGFCITDGLLGDANVLSCRYCGTGSAVETEFNVVSVDTGGHAPVPTARLSMTSSSCGICGTEQIDELCARLAPLPEYELWDRAVLFSMVEGVREAQELFDHTGGVHAAAAFTRTGEIVMVREDIGRHNAVDKVVGALSFAGRLPARELALFVSGRASFEMVQKAWAAGFEALVSVSAPSSLAIEVAERAGLTLMGFVRGDECNIYVEPVVR